MYRYLSGLLADLRRKNSWQMAEAIGEATPRGVQHLLNDAHWDADDVRDDLREYVVEHLGDEQSSVLIVDETGFLKKGEKSVGVARQYTGTAGKKENCQVGVFLCYASKEGAAFIDRSGAVPAARVDGRSAAALRGRCPRGSKVCDQRRVGQSDAAQGVRGGRSRAVDRRRHSLYGMRRGLRGWLEKRERSYVLAVTSSKGIYHEGRQRQVRQVAQSLPEGFWIRASAGKGSKGDRLYDWACVSLPESEAYCAGDRQRDAGC